MTRLRSVDLGKPLPGSLDGVCEVLLVRHGEQALYRNMSLAEAYDAPLSELGRRQAAAVGARLSETWIDAVYSSTAVRARDTGRAIAEYQAHLSESEVVEMDSLKEIDIWRDLPQHMGLIDALGAEGLTEILHKADRTGRWDAYPHAEPRDEFRARVAGAVDGIAARHDGQRVVIACHGGVINCYLARLFESRIDNVCAIYHTSITTVRVAGDRRRVIQVNDYAHALDFPSEIPPADHPMT